MSRNCCNNESSCCNNNCCNPCNCYSNGISNLAGSWFYMLAIFLLFGGSGFAPGSFWSDYGKIFRCSGFNNAWCDNIVFNKFNNGIFNNDNFDNFNFGSNNLFNANLSSTGLLEGLSDNNNFDIGNLTNSYN